MMIIEDLPICKNYTENQRFINVRNQAKKNIPLKPCTKLQYKTETELWPHPNQNETVFRVEFVSPFKVKVKEEFFIFDLVSVISAIGGTMGLCTGFSFTQLYNCFCGLIMLGIRKVIGTQRFPGHDYVLPGYETTALKRKGMRNQNKRKRRARDHLKL